MLKCTNIIKIILFVTSEEHVIYLWNILMSNFNVHLIKIYMTDEVTE